MRLKDIRMGYKILVLVLVGIIGMAALGLSGYLGMSKASDDIDDMYSRKLKATRWMGSEMSLMRGVQMNIVKHILDPKDKAIEEALAERINKYGENWAKYKPLGMQSELAAAEIPHTEALWDKYMKEIQEVKNLVAEGKKDEAAAAPKAEAAPAEAKEEK